MLVVKRRAVCPRKEDERLPGQRIEVEGRGRGQYVLSRQRDQHFLFDDRDNHKAAYDERRGADESGVDPAGPQAVDQLRGAAFDERYAHPGKTRPVILNDGRNDRIERSRARKADADHSLIAASDALHPCLRLLHLIEDRPSIVEKNSARIGQLDAASEAMKQ
jgi:hypothetical protein